MLVRNSFGKGSVIAMSKYRYTANDIHLLGRVSGEYVLLNEIECSD